jgi:hypothetical protein
MKLMEKRVRRKTVRAGLVLLLATCVFIIAAGAGHCETYGTKDARGEFAKKVTIVVGEKDLVLKKINPEEKFASIAITLNPRNAVLMRNVGKLKMEWIAPGNRPGRPFDFVGPRFDPNSRTFKDTMKASVSLRIIDTSNKKLFAGKNLADLFTIRIDDAPIVPAESVEEQDRTVQFGRGRDVSIVLDRSSLLFDESNLKKGEILDVDNRSKVAQVLGIEIPATGFILDQVRRRDQTRIPKEEWGRFPVPPDSGIFIVLIPDPDPNQLAQLEGKNLIIKVFQGETVREVHKVPIQIASDLKKGSQSPNMGPSEQPTRPTEPVSTSKPTATTQTPAQSGSQQGMRGTMWFWILAVFNLVLLVSLTAYGIFFVLPKIQVLEDRLAKNEMFIHGSREAIREELEQIKEEILSECQRDSHSE